MSKSQIVRNGCITFGVVLVLIGYFSPWVPHPAAGLAITGFEMAEWIKFAPEVREQSAGFRRMDFYFPPVAAVIGLVALTTDTRKWRWRQWAPIVLAFGLSLLPFPLLEEVNSLSGIKANWGRLALVAYGLLAAGIAVWFRVLPTKFRGVGLILSSGLALALTSLAFSAAEPIIERLLNQLVDPGWGYHLTRGGLILLILGALLLLFFRQEKRGDTN